MIRVATDADWSTIPEIHRAAFGDEGDRVARLTRELRESEWYEPGLSFVAEEGVGDGADAGLFVVRGADARPGLFRKPAQQRQRGPAGHAQIVDQIVERPRVELSSALGL